MRFVNDYSFDEGKEISMRDGFGEGVLEAARVNPKIVVLTADLAESTRVDQFAEQFPERFFEVGVAEQNLVGIAAGMAHEGLVPFTTSYAVFSPGRTWDQIRVSVCYSDNNVKIIGSHAGLSVGPDGATHQALEDVALMRVLPNMCVVVPADSLEVKKAVFALAKHKGPAYLRLSRDKVPLITNDDTPFELGKAVTVVDGDDITLLANGPMVYLAMRVAERLKDKVSVRILNVHTVKPIDEQSIVEAAHETGALVTIEDHQISGGLGGAVAEIIAECCPVPLHRMGIRDSFGESGTSQELYNHFGLNVSSIVDAVEKVLARKHAHKS